MMRARKVSKGIFTVLTALALVPAVATAQDLAFKGFTLIDGTGAAPVPDAAMTVSDGRITWVGSASALKAPAGTFVVDLAGKYVMPGMIDTHVHVGLTVDGLAVDAKNQTRGNVVDQLRQFAAYGVTTVLSQGTDQDVLIDIRNEQNVDGRPAMARLYSAGLGVVAEGGYGGLAGVTKKVSNPAEARVAVDREVARNVDMVKFWLDSELATMPSMSSDISSAVINQAHAKGTRAVSHIFYLADAKRLFGQGIDGLTHAVRDRPVDQSFLRDMKGRGIWQVASTLARERALFAYGAPAPWLDDPFFQAAVTPQALNLLKDPKNQAKIASGVHFAELAGFLATAQRNLKAISDAGIPYAMGTDAGGPMRFAGFSEHDELQLMVEAGLTPMQAIVAATSSGARFLKNDDLGSIEAGNWADLIVLEKNPLENIHNSRTISSVYIAGRQVPSVSGLGE